MLKREEWQDISRKLDWQFSYVRDEDVYPEEISGRPWLPHSEWKSWNEPFRTTYSEYVINQSDKDASLYAVQDAVGKLEDYQKLSGSWINSLKLHSATLPLAEFAAVVGNLRAARFGRDSAWRSTALLGGLDEFRHTQIPLTLMQELLKWDGQFDWTHKFYHTGNWVAIAARHFFDELLIGSNPIEFAIATNIVFESGFTNLQFVGLASLAHQAGDKMFEKMVTSIQTDEARHSQIGHSVLPVIIKHDPEYAQYLLDKWFWRSWHLFAIVTGFSMDYLTPLQNRTQSFKEFMEEWVLDQYLRTIKEFGMKKPWYWDIFLKDLENYHHMVYASAYTYRSTVWFDFALPSPHERMWLKKKYTSSWEQFDAVWEQISKRWEQTDIGNDFGVHGTSIIGFCDLCQVVLCAGTPFHNTSMVTEYEGKKFIFCSEPCRWIFEKEPERYSDHKNLVKRVLDGEAPGNVVALIRQYFDLDFGSWGKDYRGGDYPWLKRPPERSKSSPIMSFSNRRIQDNGKLIPLYGFLQGDTLGLLILAYENESVERVIRKLQDSAGVRVKCKGSMKMIHNGQTLNPKSHLMDVGIRALDRVDVIGSETNGI